jgi:hypothetical protein
VTVGPSGDPELETRTSGETASPSTASATLTRWGPFEHLACVGRGGFGEVYRAFEYAADAFHEAYGIVI